MKNNLKSVYFFSIIFFVVDQAIKIFLSNSVQLNQSIPIIKDFFSITHVHNTGAAFSIFTGNTAFLILIGIACVIAISIYIKKIENLSDLDIFIYSLLIGGILGNLFDRIYHGYVIDYLSFNFGSYYFPIFNFADICIVVSIGLIIINTIREDLWK
ncbi:MAG: signal peptidase II [Bacilli bacterium]|nr:signal peptidase II [Bacilli bacterium]